MSDAVDQLTPADLAARTERAVAAAAAAGRDLGLAVTDPTVLYDVFSVIVHLRPAPVVVRVPTVLPPLPDAERTHRAAQRVELDVTGWLARRGFPVVPPSPLVPDEPVQRDGFSMTFWQYVEQDEAAEADDVRCGELIAGLHCALRDYPGELPFLSALQPSIPAVRDFLASRPDLLTAGDLDRAEREWAAIEPLLTSVAAFTAAFPGVALQPLHGDAPTNNVIATPAGLLLGDFELVTYGPVEWDLTFVGAAGVAAYADAARRLGLAAPDERVLQLMQTARMLQLVACLSMVPQLPMLAEGLQAPLQAWRDMPFAGGLA